MRRVSLAVIVSVIGASLTACVTKTTVVNSASQGWNYGSGYNTPPIAGPYAPPAYYGGPIPPPPAQIPPSTYRN